MRRASAAPRRLQIRSRLIRRFLAHLSSVQVDVAAFVRAEGLPEAAPVADDVVVTVAALQDFFAAAERVTEDPLLGVHVAANIRRGDHGLLEFVGRSTATVREALATIGQYGKVLNETIAYSFEERDGEGLLEEKIEGVSSCIGRHGNEYFVMGILTYLRQTTGHACVPVRVWFAHEEPPDVDEVAHALGTTRLEFDRGANGAAFDTHTLDLPILSHDAALLELLERQAAAAIAPEVASVPLVGQLRALLRDTLPDNPSLDEISARLAMSPRTLQRRLDEVGSTYAAQLEVVREELARSWVVDSNAMLGELAARLGYADTRGFLRAFKRWTGMTPKQFRARG